MSTLMKDVAFGRILCAVDLSSRSRQTVEAAAMLAAAHDAELRLFYVQQPGEQGDVEHVIASLFALAPNVGRRVRVSAAVTAGDLASEIQRHATLFSADLIVLGVDAAASVAAHARCPVISLPERMAP